MYMSMFENLLDIYVYHATFLVFRCYYDIELMKVKCN